jgi:hypothetical protein
MSQTQKLNNLGTTRHPVLKHYKPNVDPTYVF